MTTIYTFHDSKTHEVIAFTAASSTFPAICKKIAGEGKSGRAYVHNGAGVVAAIAYYEKGHVEQVPHNQYRRFDMEARKARALYED